MQTKKYLYPSGGAYVSAVVVATCLFTVLSYAMFFDTCRFLMSSNVVMPFVATLICLVLIVLIESNMMIFSSDKIFFYGMDCAEYLNCTPESFQDLLLMHQSLFSPEDQLDEKPKSPFVRKYLFLICALMIVQGMIITGYNLCELIVDNLSELIIVIFLFAIDVGCLINRIWFRSSLRFLWARFHKRMADVLQVEQINDNAKQV